MRHWSATKYLLAGQIVFFVTLGVACGLLFNRTLLSDGISYFGVHLKTIVPYATGFLGVSWCLWQAGRVVPGVAGVPIIRLALNLMSMLMLGILATPYTLSSLSSLIHDCFGAALFLTQVLLMCWITFWMTKRFLHKVLYTAQLLAAVSAGLSLIHITNTMFYSQVICQACFAALVVQEIAYLSRTQEMLVMAATVGRTASPADSA